MMYDDHYGHTPHPASNAYLLPCVVQQRQELLWFDSRPQIDALEYIASHRTLSQANTTCAEVPHIPACFLPLSLTMRSSSCPSGCCGYNMCSVVGFVLGNQQDDSERGDRGGRGDER